MNILSRTGVLASHLLTCIALLAVSGTALSEPVFLPTIQPLPPGSEVLPVQVPPDSMNGDGGGVLDPADQLVENDLNIIDNIATDLNAVIAAYDNCLFGSPTSSCTSAYYGEYSDNVALYDNEVLAYNEAVAEDLNSDYGASSSSSSVPEPATLALFGLGLVGLGLSRRRLARCDSTA